MEVLSEINAGKSHTIFRKDVSTPRPSFPPFQWPSSFLLLLVCSAPTLHPSSPLSPTAHFFHYFTLGNWKVAEVFSLFPRGAQFRVSLCTSLFPDSVRSLRNARNWKLGELTAAAHAHALWLQKRDEHNATRVKQILSSRRFSRGTF